MIRGALPWSCLRWRAACFVYTLSLRDIEGAGAGSVESFRAWCIYLSSLSISRYLSRYHWLPLAISDCLSLSYAISRYFFRYLSISLTLSPSLSLSVSLAISLAIYHYLWLFRYLLLPFIHSFSLSISHTFSLFLFLSLFHSIFSPLNPAVNS